MRSPHEVQHGTADVHKLSYAHRQVRPAAQYDYLSWGITWGSGEVVEWWSGEVGVRGVAGKYYKGLEGINYLALLSLCRATSLSQCSA